MCTLVRALFTVVLLLKEKIRITMFYCWDVLPAWVLQLIIMVYYHRPPTTCDAHVLQHMGSQVSSVHTQCSLPYDSFTLLSVPPCKTKQCKGFGASVMRMQRIRIFVKYSTGIYHPSWL